MACDIYSQHLSLSVPKTTLNMLFVAFALVFSSIFKCLLHVLYLCIYAHAYIYVIIVLCTCIIFVVVYIFMCIFS